MSHFSPHKYQRFLGAVTRRLPVYHYLRNSAQSTIVINVPLLAANGSQRIENLIRVVASFDLPELLVVTAEKRLLPVGLTEVRLLFHQHRY